MPNDKVTSITRVLEILECFAGAKHELTLKEISEKVQLPTSTVHRQLLTLVDCNYLVHDPEKKQYTVGPRFLRLSSAVTGQNSLRVAARPEMEKLAERTRETVNLCQLLGNNVFYLDKITSTHPIGYRSPIGSVIPAHMTGVGKVLLSYQSDAFLEALDEYIRVTPPPTKNTVASLTQLRPQLQEVKRKGYAADIEEFDEGLICIAAPIFDMDGRATAAISVSGPTYRMQSNFDYMVASVKEAGANVSALLGYSGRR